MIHSGPPLVDGAIEIGSVSEQELHDVLVDPIAAPSMGWRERAAEDDACLYFGIRREGHLVGQIILHDIDPDAQNGFIAYHLFRAEDRGRGAGTAALGLLQRYIGRTRIVRTAVIITSRDNRASQALARRCGFRLKGAPREDPDGLLFEWRDAPVTGATAR